MKYERSTLFEVGRLAIEEGVRQLGTQKAVAEHIGVNKPDISNALHRDDRKLNYVRVRAIKSFLGKVEKGYLVEIGAKKVLIAIDSFEEE